VPVSTGSSCGHGHRAMSVHSHGTACGILPRLRLGPGHDHGHWHGSTIHLLRRRNYGSHGTSTVRKDRKLRERHNARQPGPLARGH
jgi:hypothetical protein